MQTTTSPDGTTTLVRRGASADAPRLMRGADEITLWLPPAVSATVLFRPGRVPVTEVELPAGTEFLGRPSEVPVSLTTWVVPDLSEAPRRQPFTDGATVVATVVADHRLPRVFRELVRLAFAQAES